MFNKAMQRKLDSGEAIDLSKCERQGGRYVLEHFIQDKDYCDAFDEAWIWSIGRRKSDGVILASRRVEFYQNPDYECLWLR